jgi:hypothetical protein
MPVRFQKKAMIPAADVNVGATVLEISYGDTIETFNSRRHRPTVVSKGEQDGYVRLNFNGDGSWYCLLAPDDDVTVRGAV